MSTQLKLHLQVVNESHWCIQASGTPGPALSRALHNLALQITDELGEYISDAITSSQSILLCLQICNTETWNNLQLIKEKINAILDHFSHVVDETVNDCIEEIIRLPVYYASEVAEDLSSVAELCALSPDEVILIHSEKIYSTFAIGFSIGFAYLGELDQRLSISRKSTPRISVPAGSVAIAERQTAVYPQPSPGGWHIIGRCPLLLVDISRDNFGPFSLGCSVQFYAIDKHEFIQLGGQLQ
ncbi:MAG: allophanate hydrolase subunit 1 [Planctomycetes bacterium]|nr:allophanate hydrolase subunit 1 [Planctomycetota bacterium]